SSPAPLTSTRVTGALPPGRPPRLASTAHNSVGTALEIASRANQARHPALAASIHHAASTAFFHGLGIACLLAAGVSAAGAVAALVLLPAHPSIAADDQRAAPGQAEPAPAPR